MSELIIVVPTDKAIVFACRHRQLNRGAESVISRIAARQCTAIKVVCDVKMMIVVGEWNECGSTNSIYLLTGEITTVIVAITIVEGFAFCDIHNVNRVILNSDTIGSLRPAKTESPS